MLSSIGTAPVGGFNRHPYCHRCTTKPMEDGSGHLVHPELLFLVDPGTGFLWTRPLAEEPGGWRLTNPPEWSGLGDWAKRLRLR